MLGRRVRVKEATRLAREQGWTVTKTNKNHWKFVSPHGDIVVTSSTPSDWRTERNFLARLRRAGFRDQRSTTMTDEQNDAPQYDAHVKAWRIEMKRIADEEAEDARGAESYHDSFTA